MEKAFKAKLLQDRMSININSASFSKSKYDEIMEKVKLAKSKQSHKQPGEYRLLKRYEILGGGLAERLIVPMENNKDERYQFYVHDDDLFQILMDTHLSLDHGGRDQMMNELRKNYKNITYKDVMIFLSVCKTCNERKRGKKQELGKSSLEKLNAVCQVELLDFGSSPDGEFRFIMIYQEISTRFCLLKALKSDDAKEVADNLLDIFTLIGPPNLLQSEKTGEFIKSVIDNIKDIWSDLEIGYIKSEQEGSIHSEMESMVTNWMRNNKTSKWVEGLQFVQLKKNTTPHSAINNTTPYEALFHKPLDIARNNADSKEQHENVMDAATMEDTESSEEEPEEIKEETESLNEEKQNENLEEYTRPDIKEEETSSSEEEYVSCQYCGLFDHPASNRFCHYCDPNRPPSPS